MNSVSATTIDPDPDPAPTTNSTSNSKPGSTKKARGPLRDEALPKPIRRNRQLGNVQLVLDEGETTEILGIVYGLAHQIKTKDYRLRVFLDHYNRRLKVLEYKATNYRPMLEKLDFLAAANRFDKITFQAAKGDWEVFLRYGYVLEGLLKHVRRGKTAYMVSKFKSQRRLQSRGLMKEIELIELIMKRDKRVEEPTLPDGYFLDYAREDDIDGMLTLYRRVFKTYPSPLTYREYLMSVLHRDAIFRVIRNEEGDVVAAASAELQPSQLSAELTDCATHPDERGNGLMTVLLKALEDDLRREGYLCAYTMARAPSYGMNAAFHSLGYEFNGRMVNNCDIFGDFEDMNLWVKSLRQKKSRASKSTRARLNGTAASKRYDA